MAVPKIIIGADPELFVRNKITGQYVSAHSFIPGTKDKPHSVDTTKFNAVQLDGVAAEFNINPTSNSEKFTNSIQYMIGKLSTFLPADHELAIEPAIEFDPIIWKNIPDNVKTLGCNPDYNGWTEEINPSPDGSSTTMRTASGHIHISWFDKPVDDPMEESHFQDCCIVAKQLDYYLGIMSLLWDSDPRRRNLYGKAGAFRPKRYGMEYRTLSNSWLRDPKLCKYVHDTAIYAMHNLFNNNRMDVKLGDKAREIIDNGIAWWNDKTLYTSIVSKFKHNYVPPVEHPFLKIHSKARSVTDFIIENHPSFVNTSLDNAVSVIFSDPQED